MTTFVGMELDPIYRSLTVLFYSASEWIDRVTEKYWIPTIDNSSPTYLALLIASILSVVLTLIMTMRDTEAAPNRLPRSLGVSKEASSLSAHSATYAWNDSTNHEAELETRPSFTRAPNFPKDSDSNDEADVILEKQSKNAYHDDETDECDVTKSSNLPTGQVFTQQTRLHKYLKRVERGLTESEMAEETLAKQKQLDKIFSLIKKNEDKFGEVSMEDLNNQMNLYTAK